MSLDHFGSYLPTENQATSKSNEISLTKDELNALQYVGGVVPHALLKRYERSTGQIYERFFECLGNMAVVSDTSDFIDYTKEWMSKVNRGGLFPLNDMTFLLFVEIEKQTRLLLPDQLIQQSSTSDELKDNVIEKIKSNDDVQWQWTLISQCIDSEDDAIWLLNEIVKLYVTIRGFSIAATWMEVYKKQVKKRNKEDRWTKKTIELKTMACFLSVHIIIIILDSMQCLLVMSFCHTIHCVKETILHCYLLCLFRLVKGVSSPSFNVCAPSPSCLFHLQFPRTRSKSRDF